MLTFWAFCVKGLMGVLGFDGSHNQINQTNVNVNNNSSNRKNDSSDPLNNFIAIGSVALAALITTAYFYLLYFEVIFFYLAIGTITAGLIQMGTLIPQYQMQPYKYRYSLPTVFGMLLMAAQLWVIVKTFQSLPPEIIDIAHRPTSVKGTLKKAFEVWDRFNNDGHSIIFKNIIAAIALTLACVFSNLYALYRLFADIARLGQHKKISATLAKWLYFSHDWGGYASVVLTLVAYLIINDMLFVL